jgi:hypothetical protein
MGQACSINGGDEKLYTKLHSENAKETDHLGDPGVNGKALLNYVLEKYGIRA